MSAAIGSASAFANTTNTTPGANSLGELDSDEFLQIILSELSNQDPLAPNDTAAILEQLSSIRNIESQVALEDKLDTLVTQNAIASGSQMIGSFVKGLDSLNNTVEGLVESLSVQDGKPILKLAGGDELAADRVTEVLDLSDLNGQVVQSLLMDLQVLDSSKLVGMQVSGQVLDENGGVQTRSGTVTGVELISDENRQNTLPANAKKYKIPAVCAMRTVSVNCINFVDYIKQSNQVFG